MFCINVRITIGNIVRATEIIHQSVLYVTVEPCIMCAGALRLIGIILVYSCFILQ